eukprot:9170324-Ditylum_brightwellii.AAC.1
MYDLLVTLNGIDSPETYIKGHLTLEYAIGTMELIPSLKSSWWLSYHFLTLADYRGIILDFNANHLFRGEIFKIKEKYLNQVSTKQYRKSAKYRQEVMTQFQQKQIRERAKHLIKDKTTTVEKIEELDKEVTKIMIQTEKKMPKLPDF